MQEILKKVQYGDYVFVGIMLGITGDYAKKLIMRKSAKRHPEAIKALRQVIYNRQKEFADAYEMQVDDLIIK
jgi:DNA-binding transcriptional regulator YiaG